MRRRLNLPNNHAPGRFRHCRPTLVEWTQKWRIGRARRPPQLTAASSSQPSLSLPPIELRPRRGEWTTERSCAVLQVTPTALPGGIVGVINVCGALGKELAPWTRQPSYRAPRRSGRRGRKDDRTPALFREGLGAIDLDRRGRPAISIPSRG